MVAFLAQVDDQLAGFRNVSNQSLRAVSVEVVHHKDPFCLWIGGYCPGDVVSKILLGTSVAQGWNDGISCHHVKVSNQTQRAVATIFVLNSLRFSAYHGFARRDSLQSLNSSHFIHTYRMAAFFFKAFRRLQVALADDLHFTLKLFRVVDLRIQPILDTMRFQVALILKNDRLVGSKSNPQFPVSAPRQLTHLASSG